MSDFSQAVFAASAVGGGEVVMILIITFILLAILIGLFSRYKKCPSDRIMVIYGKCLSGGAKGQHASRCIHGGAAFIIPIIQDYAFLSLRPIQLEVPLKNALCKQNIRISVPSVFTVGISTDEELMGNAANRLLGLAIPQPCDLCRWCVALVGFCSPYPEEPGCQPGGTGSLYGKWHQRGVLYRLGRRG